MSNILNFVKTVSNVSKMDKELKDHASLGSIFNFIVAKENDLKIHFTAALTQQNIDDCTAYVNAFVEISVHDNLYNYLEKDVEPFIHDLMTDIAATNIEMGITQAGKTLEVLGFFEKAYLLPGKARSVSLKGSLDTNSLTVTMEIIGYLLSNPSEYSDLSPFIDAARLTEMYNKIATYLGAPTI